jgi:hypothetical protein
LAQKPTRVLLDRARGARDFFRVRRLHRPLLLPALGAVGALALAGLRGGPSVPGLLASALALTLAIFVARASDRRVSALLFGAAVALASSVARAPAEHPALVATAWIGAAVAAASATIVVAGAALPEGLAAEHRRLYPGPPRAVLLALCAGPPAALAVERVLAVAGHGAGLSASSASAVGLAAGAFGGAAALGATLVARRLELGTPDRLRAALGLLVVANVAAVPALLLRVATPEHVGPTLVSATAGGAALVATRFDAQRIAEASRVLGVSLASGTALAVVVALGLVEAPPATHGPMTLVAVALAVAAGALSRTLAARLRPRSGALLDALSAARDELRRADADDAARAALAKLREPAGPGATSPELWLVDPPTVLTIDAAAYARERPGTPHPSAMEAAAREPHGVLRRELLEALEVRRPEVRPLSRWMAERDALAAALVVRDGDMQALLVIPRGGRAAPMSLEEARALAEVAGALHGWCATRQALARSMARERAARAEADALEARVARLEHEAALDAAREARSAARLARPATVGIYSATSRLAYEALERRTKAGAPFVVVARSGIDPVPFLARAHQAGLRSSAPLVLVDGTSAREHDLERWRDRASSPLALAHRGTLVLLDGAALPADVQRLVAQALAEKRAPWERGEPLDVLPALTSAVPVPELAGRLDPSLEARLSDALEHAVVLPGIAERPEDLRAIVNDRLAREGLRVRGRPVGIDDAAFARLVDHPWRGEDAELAHVVARLVAGCDGDVVRAADVERLALGGKEAEQERPSRFPGRRAKRR